MAAEREALEQAWERLDAIMSSVKDPERVATEAWFGMIEIDRALGRTPQQDAATAAATKERSED